MIPLRDENPSRSFPFITHLLILINCAVFIYQTFFLPGSVQAFIYKFGFIPYELVYLRSVGPSGWVPAPLTIITAMFLHGGWLHILSNMLFLWIFGDNVEDRLGHGRFLLFYLLCGIGAAGLHGLLHISSQVPSIGASGAIAGVLAAYMVLFPKARVKTLIIIVVFVRIVRLPAIVLLGYWFLIQVASGYAEMQRGISGGVAWFAHIGGFLAGFSCLYLLRKKSGK